MRRRAPLLLPLLAIVALTGCRFAERESRVASDAFASFVLESLLRIQTPLTQGTVQRSSSTPAPQVDAAAPAVTAEPVARPRPAIAACPEIVPIELPIRGASRLASFDLVAAAAPKTCPKVKRIRSMRIVLPQPIDIAKMQIEVRFAAAELSDARRYVVVTSDTL